MIKRLSMTFFVVMLVCTSCEIPEPGGDDPIDPVDPPISSLDERLIEILDSVHADGVQGFILPESDDYVNLPQDPRNRLNRAKVDLGRYLFFETALGINGERDIARQTYSCASCHDPTQGFRSGGRAQGVADGGFGYGFEGEGRDVFNEYLDGNDMDALPIRNPSVLNLGYQQNILWNGHLGATGLNEGTEFAWDNPVLFASFNNLGYHGPETQGIAGMLIHRLGVDSIANIEEYRELFRDAFPNTPDDEVFTPKNAGLAIAAFERTIKANRAPFQEWLRGKKDAISENEKKGAILFFGKAGCATCHTGPALNSEGFYAFGMADLDGAEFLNPVPELTETVRLGRGGFTGDPKDEHKYKVPQLYNLKDTPFYGHGASFRSLDEIVKYKNRGPDFKQNPNVSRFQLAEEFVPLGLEDDEVDAIVDFLKDALYDPDLERYMPNRLPSGNCFPNNDQQSVDDYFNFGIRDCR